MFLGELRKKLFPPAKSPAHARRYDAEILLLRRLGEAPRMPRYHRDGVTPSGARFVEYREVIGESLSVVLKQCAQKESGLCNGDGWRRFIRSLLECVCFLHERKAPIFHGDISTNNVIVTSQGLAGLIDFGVSRSRCLPFSVRFPSRQSIAAPRYMSPEQAQGDYWGSASDIYQVGLVGLELIRREPVNGALALQDILSQLRTQPDHARQLAGQVPGVTGSILTALLDPTPSKRPCAREVLSWFY